MFTEARIAAGIRAMVASIDAPPVPLEAIRPHLGLKKPRHSVLFRLTLAASAAIFALALLRLAAGFAQTIESQIEALLHWKAPPTAPTSVWHAMRSQTVTLAQARSRVAFTIVPPAGLPSNVVRERISSARSGVYSNATRAWSLGASTLAFTYRRSDGRSFRLMASRFDSSEESPSKYIFDGDERDARGMPVRHEVFTWRNGNQAMNAVDGEGINATEILAIRTAMHGIPIVGVWPPPSSRNSIQVRLPEP